MRRLFYARHCYAVSLTRRNKNTVLSEFYLEVGNNDINVENKNSLQETVTIVRFNNNYESAVI